MKIIHMSDIHGDMESLDIAYEAIKEYSEADILAITGDIAMGLNKEGSKALNDTQGFVYNIKQKLGQKGNIDASTFNTTCNYILKDENAPEKAKKLVENYMTLTKAHYKNTGEQYDFLKDRIDSLLVKKGIQTILVPGEWDTKNINDHLEWNNLHLHNKRDSVKGLGVVGYGSAKVHPGCMPLDDRILFDEVQAYNHLMSNEDAEVALIHAPVAGLPSGDVEGQENCMAKYIVERSPSLILEGHSHKPRIERADPYGTWISNPGNLGRRSGTENHGMFYEWDIDENSFVNLSRIYKVREDGKVKIQNIEKVVESK